LIAWEEIENPRILGFILEKINWEILG
jgi:hypothetical protein